MATEVQKAIIRWRKEGPAKFAVDVLGATPEDWQLEAGKLLAERRRLSVRSGHGVGKSTFLAWCILWFLTCYYPAKVPATAPTAHQLEDVLWSELAKWHRVMSERMPTLASEFVWSAGAYRMTTHPNESFSVARTSRPEKPEALQGFHADNILFLIDEASGVPDSIFEVAEGALSTVGAFVVMTANPTRQSGYFFDSHHRMRAEWATVHVDGEKCPRVSRDYIARMAKKYGKQSSIYQVRVKGNFAAAADGVIPLELCEGAVLRDVEQIAAPVVWGLDVARFGDDSTALAKRRGNHQIALTQQWYGKDTMQVSGIIKREYSDTPPNLRPQAINVDVIGIGAGVVDRLTELGLPVHGINVAEAPAENGGERQFAKLRDELWWSGREWLERMDCRLLEDEDLIGELSTPTYKILSNGLIKIEGKDEMKKRGVASPNCADAWLLTFAGDGAAVSWAKPLKYKKLYAGR